MTALKNSTNNVNGDNKQIIQEGVQMSSNGIHGNMKHKNKQHRFGKCLQRVTNRIR